jgi:superfamily II DNA or RNA helicase
VSTDSTFNPGDRVSYYGGEGTVVRVEGETLHIHTDDGEIVTHSSDLPMVSKTSEFESGERVKFPGGEGEILKVEKRSDRPDLLIIRTEDNQVKEVPADKKGVEPLADISDKLISSQFDTGSRFNLLKKATKLNLAYQFDRFLSLTGNRIDVTPHQVEAAHEILTSHDQRYLLADEVGLGKTIEAGIVIEELMARGRADRVLIVTPASLKLQWQAEMKDKFDQDYVIYDGSYVRNVRRSMSEDNVWDHDDMVITSIDFAKQEADAENEEKMLEPLSRAEWDIVVFDEAHHLTARRDSEGQKNRTQRYKVGEAVSPNTDALLFLTGTPHKGKSDQFYFMVDLLEPYRFEDENDITPEELDDLMIRRLKSNPNMVHSDGSPMFPKKEIDTLSVEFTPEEEQLYQDITDYLRNYYRLGEEQESQAAGFSMVIYQKRLVSSIRAIQRSLEKRASVLESGGKEQLPQSAKSLLKQYRERPDTLTENQRQHVEEELQEISMEQDPEERQRELEIVQELIERAREIDVDRKAKRLREAIENLLAEDPDEKVLVFTEYTDTLEYLRDEILSDYDVAQIHGGLSQPARREQVEKFRNDANIMLATDAAREGINLQFAHIMVNYDLPWNPIRIDQRLGRLHRYGQDQKVNIYNLFVEDTRESDILETLVTRVDTIEEDLGVSSDVLGMVLDDSDLNLEDRIMNAVENDESGQEVAKDIDEIIEERKEAVKKLQDNFLIEDKFGESELEEVQELIEQSREDHVGQEEVHKLLELFFSEFDGELTKSQTAPDTGEIYSVDTPSVIDLNNDEVQSSYRNVTFDQELAKEDKHIEFLSVNHPLVRAIVDYCLDGDWIDGQTTVKQTEGQSMSPGLLCNFRLGYKSADRRDDEGPETERFVPIFVTENEKVREEIPDTNGTLPPDEAENHPQVQQLSDKADTLIKLAEEEAQRRVERMAEEAEDEKEDAVDIKRQHAERYFNNAIETWESRLKERKQKQRNQEKDMTISIRQAQSKLEDLRAERKQEFEQLREEETVYPETNELVNVAVIVNPN